MYHPDISLNEDFNYRVLVLDRYILIKPEQSHLTLSEFKLAIKGSNVIIVAFQNCVLSMTFHEYHCVYRAMHRPLRLSVSHFIRLFPWYPVLRMSVAGTLLTG